MAQASLTNRSNFKSNRPQRISDQLLEAKVERQGAQDDDGTQTGQGATAKRPQHDDGAEGPSRRALEDLDVGEAVALVEPHPLQLAHGCGDGDQDRRLDDGREDGDDRVDGDGEGLGVLGPNRPIGHLVAVGDAQENHEADQRQRADDQGHDLKDPEPLDEQFQVRHRARIQTCCRRGLALVAAAAAAAASFDIRVAVFSDLDSSGPLRLAPVNILLGFHRD